MQAATLSIPMQPVQSSQIAAIGHDAGSGTLRVQFHGSGATYDYDGVTPGTFAAFQQSESKGKFFGAHVKGKFTYRRLATKK
jgi:hypothetical protein